MPVRRRRGGGVADPALPARPEFIAKGSSGRMLGRAPGASAPAAGSGGIDGKTREFYEFVLPPVDVREDPYGFTVLADVPGFRMEDISVRVRGDLLTIRAEGGGRGGGVGRAVSLQRPRRLDKTVRLPAPVGEVRCTATCAEGVLAVRIPRG